MNRTVDTFDRKNVKTSSEACHLIFINVKCLCYEQSTVITYTLTPRPSYFDFTLPFGQSISKFLGVEIDSEQNNIQVIEYNVMSIAKFYSKSISAKAADRATR